MKNLEINTTAGTGKNKGSFKIQINGDFTINNLTKLQETMVEALENNQKITVESKSIDGFDFAACQLLISFYNTALNKGIETTYKLQFNEEHQAFIADTGIAFHPVFAGSVQ
jgi:anti-anti-sigma regulatory factor